MMRHRDCLKALTLGGWVVAAALAGAPAFAQAIVLRVGDNVPATSVQGVALDRFAEIVATKNVGLDVKVFHGSQLGSGPVQVQNVQLGAQDLAMGGITFLEQYSADLRIAETPFSFASRDHFEKWVRSPAFEKVHAEVVKNGGQRLINLGELWRRGPFRVLISTRPVTSLDDFGKLKLRLWESEVATRFYGKQGLGATPVNIPLGDVYLAMRQGVVDSLTLPFDLVVSMKFGEVAKHVVLVDEFWQHLPLTINEAKWQSLNAAQRKALTDAADEAGRFYNKEVAQQVDNWKKELTQAGVSLDPIDRTAFVERIRQRNQEWEAAGYWRKGLIAEIGALK